MPRIDRRLTIGIIRRVGWHRLSEHQKIVAVPGILSGLEAGQLEGFNNASKSYKYEIGVCKADHVHLNDSLDAKPAVGSYGRTQPDFWYDKKNRISGFRDYPELIKTQLSNFLSCSTTVGNESKVAVDYALKYATKTLSAVLYKA